MAEKSAKIDFAPSKIKERYTQLANLRDPYLRRTEEYAKWTLPYLYSGTTQDSNQDNGSSEQETSWQSIGARAVNHLANKYMMALFPASRPFFRLDVPAKTMAEIMEATGETKTMLEFTFGNMEREAAIKQFERNRSRPALLEALKHLCISGNALVYIPKEGNLQCYNLADYVVLRDPSGDVIEIITRDKKDISTLPPELQDLLRKETGKEEKGDAPELDYCNLYTRIRWKQGRYYVHQALEQYAVEGESWVKKEMLRWVPLRWNSLRNEHYGRGLVEDSRGNFHAAHMINLALAEGVVAASDLKFLVDPNSGVDIDELTKSPTGTFHYGEKDSVHMIETTNSQVWQFLISRLEHYEREIGMTFLLNSAATRDAERVTAQEIRVQAHELETSHGGVYSTLATDLQAPIATFNLEQVGANVLAGKNIEPIIITGLEALGRAADLENLQLWLQDLVLLKDLPESFLAEFEPKSYLQFSAAARGVEYTKFLKTPEQKNADASALQQQQLTSEMLTAGIQGVGNAVGKSDLNTLASAARTAAPAMGVQIPGQ